MLNIGMMTRGIKLASRFFHRDLPQTWTEELRSTVVRSLGDLSSSTEEEFLSLGTKLQQFNSRSRDISELSSSLTAMMSGKEMADATAGLRQILDGTQDRDGSARQGTEILKVILEKIEAMHDPLIGFGRIVRNLRILCTFIKIESARLECGDTGFDTLSADVGTLAANIASKSADLFEQSLVLATMVKRNLGQISEFERNRQGQARVIVDGAGHCLDSLTEKHALSLATVKDVATRWNQITRSIGEVVSSLQFHDITRQRIEHVEESLAEITDRSPGALTTCELQRAQLDHARLEVVSAIERIIRSLQDIARHVDEICEETGTLVKVANADASGSSFISSLEKSFSALTGSIAAYDRIDEELSATIDHAVHTIGAMSTFIGDIEKIGIEIRMIGLNACIRAAHVGEKGAALGVLADSIHELSGDTSGLTDAISENLRKVIQAARELTDGIKREAAGGTDGRHRLEQEVARMMKPLRRVDEETLALLNGIEGQGNALSDDLASASAGIQVHEQFDRSIEDVIGRLDAFTARMKQTLSAQEQADSRTDLKGLAGRYTMHSERQVHQAVAGKAIGAAPLPIAAPAVAAAETTGEPAGEGREDLGDNVELF